MLPRCLVVLLLLLSSFSSLQGGHAAISISVRPLVEVELGRPLVVPCTYNVSVASGVVTQWFIISTTSRVRISYRDLRRFVADGDTGYTDRIDAQRDDSALALDATVVADERDFICQVFAGRAGVAEATTRVRLFSAPTVAVTASKRPVLLNGQRHEIGKCFVHNAYPEPHITWYKASLPLLPSPDVKVTRTVATEANGTFAVTSILSYKPEERDVGAGYRCVVNYTMPGGRSEAFASETIHVGLHYPEDVRLGPTGATQVTAGATQVTAGATQVTPSSSGIPDYKCAEAGEAVSGGAMPAPRHARPSGGSGGDGRSRCVTSPHSVPGPGEVATRQGHSGRRSGGSGGVGTWSTVDHHHPHHHLRDRPPPRRHHFGPSSRLLGRVGRGGIGRRRGGDRGRLRRERGGGGRWPHSGAAQGHGRGHQARPQVAGRDVRSSLTRQQRC
ncbi:basal cell adhesion molecule-like [Petromyzon marinus]|uniref:basal cell adhesion molecule-like n=1 Tax=Petromyzon marinus TaxID=7757 RepID=UPI003F702EBB